MSASNRDVLAYQTAMNIDSDPLQPLHALMAAARKQTLVLMVAVNDGDDELALVAATRVRDAIRAGEHVAVSLRSEPDRRAAIGMIETTRYSAMPWLARAPQRVAGARDALRLLARFGGPDIPELSPLTTRGEIADIDLNGANAPDIDISALQLRGLRARGANLDRLQATGARLSWCELIASTLAGARLEATTIEDSSFERSNLERSSWASARITRSSFAGATLIDSRLDNAVFTECDLRGVDLSVVNSTLREGSVPTMFLRCDLREASLDLRSLAGMSFVDCKLYGIHGMPLHTARVEIEGADLSPRGDGTELPSADRVRAALSCGAILGIDRR